MSPSSNISSSLLLTRLPWFYIFNNDGDYDNLIIILGIKPEAYSLIGLLIIINLFIIGMLNALINNA